MKDRIDERNFRERCSRSIVKGYNVHYLTPEEAAAQQAANEAAEAQAQNEAAAKEQETIPPAVQEEPVSSQYGQYRDDDPVTREQIAKILGEREEKVLEMIEESRIDNSQNDV
jgi:hypothetical protein